MYAPFSISGKKILVTGASSGIGKATAISLSRMGANVIALGRDMQRLKGTLQSLEGNGHSCHSLDITDIENVAAFCADAPEIEGFVHAAGILKIMPIRLLTEESVHNMINTNYMAPFNLIRQLLQHKKICNGASVVMIASVNGIYTNVKGFSSYAASKAALNSIAKSLALEYAGKKIRFNTVAPGMIKTEMYQEMINTIPAESIEQDRKRYPMGDYGEPEDVASACIYLLSDASKWVTGTCLTIDGGLTIN